MFELRCLAVGCGLIYVLNGLYYLYFSLAILNSLAMLPAMVAISVGLSLIKHIASILMGLKFFQMAVSDPNDTPNIARSVAKDALPAYLCTQGMAAILKVCLFPLMPQMIITAGVGITSIFMGLFLAKFAREHLGNPQDLVHDQELDALPHGMGFVP